MAAAVAPPNTRLLHSLILASLPSSFPDVLVKLLLSYHTNAMLLVDSSGSMYGTETKFHETWRRLEKYFGDAASFSCIGFHHARIPGYFAQATDFLKSSGLTDLSIPLDAATEALKAGCCTLILFTDGANNAASEAAMYASMHRFYEAVMELDKCWQIRFHFISVGSWWCQSTMSALSSLFGVAHQRVEVTVTDVDTFLSKGFNAPLRQTSLDEFKAIIDLRAALPPENRAEINVMLHKFIHDEEQREAKAPVVNSDGVVTKPSQRVFTSWTDYVTYLLQGDPPKPPSNTPSVQMRALLNGVAPAPSATEVKAAAKTKPKLAPELVEFLTGFNSLYIAEPLPAGFNPSATLALLSAGDYTDLLSCLVQVVGVSDGVAKKYSLEHGIQQNALKRFECLLMVPKVGIPYSSFTKQVLDKAQTRLCNVSEDMAQKTRINFLVVCLQLGLHDQVRAAIACVAECWMVDPKPYTREHVSQFSGQMLSDLRHVAQGERQSFSEGGERASNLAMLWCILGHQRAVGQCGIPFGQKHHIQLWLGVTGMWARFATDTKCWDLYTMLQTKVDLTAYAALIVGLKGKYQEMLRSTKPELYFQRVRAMLDNYVGAAQRAVAWTAQDLPVEERDESMKVYIENIHEQIAQSFAARAAAEAKTASFANAAAVIAAAEAAAKAVAEKAAEEAAARAAEAAARAAEAAAALAASQPPVVVVHAQVHAQPQVDSDGLRVPDAKFEENFPTLGTVLPKANAKVKMPKTAKKGQKMQLLLPEAPQPPAPLPVASLPVEDSKTETVSIPKRTRVVRKKASIADMKFVLPSGFAGTDKLCVEEAAAVFSLAGIFDIKALSDHAIALISLLNRKPKDNQGDQLEIFRNLSKCLKFGPQQSVRGALQFICASHPSTCRNLEEVTLTTNVINEFLTYVTTFEPLFTLPPPTGWATPEWLELHRLTGINLETVPLNAATEHQAEVFRLAKEYHQGMIQLHSREFKSLTLPRLPDGSFSRHVCGCGAEVLSHIDGGKVRLLPSGPPIRKPPPGMDPAEFARRPAPKPVGPPKVPVVVACLPDGPSPMHHLGEWARFLLQEYKAAKLPLRDIEEKLASLKRPESEEGKPWGVGSSADWLALNSQRVAHGKRTKVFVLEKLLAKVLPTFSEEVDRPVPESEEVMWAQAYWAEVLRREPLIKKEFGLP